MLKRKAVGIGIAVVIVSVFGVSQLQAQSTLTLESLSNRVTTLARRVTALSGNKADKDAVRALETRVSALEAELGAAKPTNTPTRRRPTSTATRPRPTSTPTRVRPTATPTPAKAYITITRNMNVRRGPNTTYEVVGYATIGQEYDITGKNADGSWWRIDFKGENAWIYAPYVTAVGAGRIRSVPTPIPPTSVPPTATPVPASNTTRGMSEEDIIQSVMLTDYQYNESAFNNLTQSQKEYVVTGYILLLEYVTDYCGLSYGSMAQLLDSYASDLDEIRFTGEDGAKPRGWLMAFIYGFTRDSAPGSYSCNTVLDWGRAAAMSN